MRAFLLASWLLSAALLPRPAQAHAHVWVEATLAFVFEEQQLVALDVTWLFDDLYSLLVREDFDLDGDGSLSQQELDALVGISAANLVEFSFFTHIKIDGEKRPVWAVKEFYADVVGELVRYRFRVPLNDPIDPWTQRVSVGLFDDTYYVDIGLPPGDVTVEPANDCSVTLENDETEPLYFGTYYPTYAVLHCGTR